MRKSRFLAGLAALAIGAAGVPAGAENVPITLSNPSGTRVIAIEDMTGTALTSLDFGTTRELPSRVRVQDTDYTRSDFSVSAEMTNLYIHDGTAYDYSKKIPSSEISLGSQVNPLSVLNLSATVQTTVNTVTTVTDGAICTVLGLTGSSCTLNTTGLTSKVVEDLGMTIDNLTDLPALPIVPQVNDQGSFDSPSFAAGSAGENDPAKTITPATALTLAEGQAALSPVLTELDTALATLPLDQVVNPDDVVAALQSQFPLVWGLLSTAQVASILAATDAVPVPLTAAGVLSLTGTYFSLPTLGVNVPTTAATGNYQGTMVVTGLQ
jgi:hypothetical protein